VRGRLIQRTWAYDPALHAPPRYRRACAYEVFVPDPVSDLDLTLPGAAVAVVSEAEAAIAALNRERRPELIPFARLLLRTESIASSKVEGLQLGSRGLARAEAREAAGGRVGAEAAEVIGNIDAMQFAIEEASAGAVTPATFIDIHRMLMRRAPNATIAGQVRTTQGWIGGNDYNPCGADYVPPPHDEISALLLDLAVFSDRQDLSPLVQAALAHAQFETIHPFPDGNGRTGRAVIHVILRRRRLAPSFVPPISVVFANAKAGYIRGLERFREDALPEWIESFCVAAAQAAGLASRYQEHVRDLQDEWRQQLRASSSPRADAASWALIDVLPAHPVITVAVGVAATGRTKPAVTNGIAALEGAGVLAPLGTSQRNRAWEADRLLDLIEGLESNER
jgi:Fic family protein